jgi:hypothetical protein
VDPDAGPVMITNPGVRQSLNNQLYLVSPIKSLTNIPVFTPPVSDPNIYWSIKHIFCNNLGGVNDNNLPLDVDVFKVNPRIFNPGGAIQNFLVDWGILYETGIYNVYINVAHYDYDSPLIIEYQEYLNVTFHNCFPNSGQVEAYIVYDIYTLAPQPATPTNSYSP